MSGSRWDKVSKLGKDFVYSMYIVYLELIQKSPNSRLTIEEIKAHKWLQLS
jgi:hypothetical protein